MRSDSLVLNNLVVTHAMAIVEMLFYRVSVEKPKSQKPRNGKFPLHVVGVRWSTTFLVLYVYPYCVCVLIHVVKTLFTYATLRHPKGVGKLM
jgi:hypothetical protein